MTTPQTSPSFSEEARVFLVNYIAIYKVDDVLPYLQALHDRLVQAARVEEVENLKRAASLFRQRTDYPDGTTFGDTSYLSNDAGFGWNECIDGVTHACDKRLAALVQLGDTNGK